MKIGIIGAGNSSSGGFSSAVTGHLRSDEAAATVADERLARLG